MNEYENILNALDMSFARRNLINFTEYNKDDYEPNWHHYLIADRLERLIAGEITQLIINIPPRHGKSELASRMLPPFYFSKNKNKYIIGVSYGISLAEEMGLAARNIVASPEYGSLFNDIRLSRESAAKTNWRLQSGKHAGSCPKCGSNNWSKKPFGRQICKTCGTLGAFAGTTVSGAYLGAGIKGGITGKGAHLLIVDDPVKNRAEAESPTFRNMVWSEFASTAYTRQEKDAVIIIIQTRWHEDDLTGRLIEKSKNSEHITPWEVLKLKAIAEEDEEYEIFNPDYIKRLGTNMVGRIKGDALWPSKYPIEKLLEFKEFIGTYEFSALYQQSPQPSGGGLFKRKDFRYADMDGEIYTLNDGKNSRHCERGHCFRFMTGDLAIKDNESADNTVFCTWDLSPENDLILIDIYREKIDGAYHGEIVHSLYSKFKPEEICIESVQYQATLVQQLVRDGLPARELKADKSKFTRALPVAAKFEAHKVFILNGIANIEEAEKELIVFPSGMHDDIVDNIAYAGRRAIDYAGGALLMPETDKDNFNKNDNSISNKLDNWTM